MQHPVVRTFSWSSEESSSNVWPWHSFPSSLMANLLPKSPVSQKHCSHWFAALFSVPVATFCLQLTKQASFWASNRVSELMGKQQPVAWMPVLVFWGTSVSLCNWIRPDYSSSALLTDCDWWTTLVRLAMCANLKAEATKMKTMGILMSFCCTFQKIHTGMHTNLPAV